MQLENNKKRVEKMDARKLIKKPYSNPKLTVYGSVEKITKGGQGQRKEVLGGSQVV